ncbi:MAG: ABC transporter permease [Chloroflexi bacterium]|nr:ABC transporter permease [Chloroflexota bacterium]
MQTITTKRPSHWRLRWAIVRKEIINIAQHNYYLISLAIPLLMSLVFTLLFAAINQSNEVTLIVYDAGNSTFVAALQAEPNLNLLSVTSETEMLAQLNEATGGLSIPANFDTAVTSGQIPELTVLLNTETRNSVQARLQQIISDQVWQTQYGRSPTQIIWQDFTAGSDAYAAFTSANYLLLTLVTLAISMAGLVILPQLMVEEKEKATLPALLASPATYGDLIFGKATAVFLYILVVTVVIGFLNQGFSENWLLTITATLLLIGFAIGAGSLFGMWVDTKNHCNEYSVILMLGLNLPIWFTVVNVEALSPILQIILRLIPSYYFANTLMHSLNGIANPAQIGQNLLILTLCTAVVFALLIWQIRQRPLWQS